MSVKNNPIVPGAVDTSYIDCDVHTSYKKGEIVEYLPKNYREQQGYNLPQGMWTNPDLGFLDEPIAIDSGTSEVTPELLANDVLEYAESAILNPDGMLMVSTSPQIHYAPALARAYNDWFIDTWLDYDDRFVGSMLVAPQRPEKAAKEIERIGDHPQIKQVIMGSATESPYGRPQYWPIYEAAVKHGLPVALHPGPSGHGIAPPSTGAGYVRTYFEKHSAEVDHLIGQLTSLVSEGVFVEYPDLKFVFIEAGITWLPTVLWRADKDWKSLRSEVPYLKDPPSSYIARNCWFSTHPLPLTVDEKHFHQILEMLPAEDILLYGSSYPYTAEGTAHDLTELEEPLQSQILYQNAADIYGLD